jgi:hypothetical protein
MADHGHVAVMAGRVYFQPMNAANDNQVDWTAASTPSGDAAPGLARNAKATPRALPTTRRGVMETLLGKNNLAAQDAGGSDPYNATGRQFRR